MIKLKRILLFIPTTVGENYRILFQLMCINSIKDVNTK